MANSIDFFGLDLGNYSLKLSYIKKGSGVRLESLYSKPTIPGVLANSTEDGLKNLALEIKQLHSDAKIPTRNCVFSVPEQSVFSRLLVVPKVEDVNIDDAIHWGIKPLVPAPLETVSIAYTDIDEIKIDGKPYINWYVVAAPKDMIERMRKVASLAGVNLLAIETEALATARLVSYSTNRLDDILIMDLGADNSNIILARNAVAIYSQTLSTGSNAMTKILAADFGLDETQAETLKKQLTSQSPESLDKILKSMEPIIQILISELSRTLVYYKEKLGNKNIDKIYLTGGGAKLYMLDKLIGQTLNIPVEVVNPLNRIDVSKKLKDHIVSENVSSYSVSLGISLKGVI